MKMVRTFTTVFLLVVLGSAQASQFRESRSIAGQVYQRALDGGWVASSYPLNTGMVEHAVALVAENYRRPTLSDFLGERFNNRNILVDDIRANLPLDAVMRVLSMGSPRVLNQYQRYDEQGNLELWSRVAVNVRSQLEFSDPKFGFQIREDTSEWVVNIKTRRLLVPIPEGFSNE